EIDNIGDSLVVIPADLFHRPHRAGFGRLAEQAERRSMIGLVKLDRLFIQGAGAIRRPGPQLPFVRLSALPGRRGFPERASTLAVIGAEPVAHPGAEPAAETWPIRTR